LAPLGRSSEAVSAYHTALALDASFADAHSNLSATLRDGGDLAGAFENAKKAIALGAGAVAYNNLGLALTGLDRLPGFPELVPSEQQENPSGFLGLALGFALGFTLAKNGLIRYRFFHA
jgi:Flp pilus assembly protein TadD